MTSHQTHSGPDAPMLANQYLGPALAVAMVALTVLAGLFLEPRLPPELLVGIHVDAGGALNLRRAPTPAALVGLWTVTAVFASGYLAARVADARLDDSQYRRRIDVIGLLAVAAVCVGQLLVLIAHL